LNQDSDEEESQEDKDKSGFDEEQLDILMNEGMIGYADDG
jgi:hypothetical protein